MAVYTDFSGYILSTGHTGCADVTYYVDFRDRRVVAALDTAGLNGIILAVN